ncbi:MAG: hypothetical protein IKU46_04095 [Peptococcaceae bacterium]|nr:hypothetical protein [Peptococcaceae bacterium]
MKNTKVKKVVSVLLCCTVLMFMPITALATDVKDQVTEIQPRLTYIVDAEAGLSINNGIATVDCWVKGHYNDATKAKVIAELQVKGNNGWIAYGTWVDTQNDYEAAVYETKGVTKGNTYRVKATVTVWEGNASEELFLFTDEVKA